MAQQIFKADYSRMRGWEAWLDWIVNKFTGLTICGGLIPYPIENIKEVKSSEKIIIAEKITETTVVETTEVHLESIQTSEITEKIVRDEETDQNVPDVEASAQEADVKADISEITVEAPKKVEMSPEEQQQAIR